MLVLSEDGLWALPSRRRARRVAHAHLFSPFCRLSPRMRTGVTTTIVFKLKFEYALSDWC